MEPEISKSGKNTFPSKEKLKSRKSIQSLFEIGKSMQHNNIRVYYVLRSDDKAEPLSKFAVSVSKRIFKKAVDRNKIKRQLREAYRLHKKELLKTCADHNFSIDAMWIYTKPEFITFNEIKSSTIKLMENLIRKIVTQQKDQKA